MWNWKDCPHRHSIAAGIFVFGLALSSAGLWCGIAAQRETQVLARRIDTAVQNFETKLDRLAVQPSSTRVQSYLLRTCEGKIGIYNGEGTVLYEILDVDVRTLPAADRAMLEEGIIVSGEAALRALTEDYSS